MLPIEDYLDSTYLKTPVQSGLSEEEQALTLNYARRKSGDLVFNPVTGRLDNKFVPVNIIKNPDVSQVIDKLKNEIVPEETTLYVDPNDTTKKSRIPFDGALEEKIKQRVLTKEKVADIENMMLNNPNYKDYISRMAEIGGKEYAEAKHKSNMASIVSGLNVGNFSQSTFSLNDIDKEVIKHGKIKSMDRKQEEADSRLVDDLVLPTSINSKLHDFETIGDLDRDIISSKEKGDNIRSSDVTAYKKRLQDKYHLSNKDYDLYNLWLTHHESVPNDKKQLFRKMSEDIKADSQLSSTSHKTFTLSKESDLKVLDRSFKHALSNLHSNSKSGMGMLAEDAQTGQPLSDEQKKYLNDAEFTGIVTSSDGVYYMGRSFSNKGNREEKGDGTGKGDFTFRVKVPNQGDVISTLVKMKKLDAKTGQSLILTQGLDRNFGNKKPIRLSNGENIYVKRLLPSERPSEGGDYQISRPNGEKINVSSYEELLKIINKLQ